MNAHRELTDALDITAVETTFAKTYLGDWMPSRWDYMYYMTQLTEISNCLAKTCIIDDMFR